MSLWHVRWPPATQPGAAGGWACWACCLLTGCWARTWLLQELQESEQQLQEEVQHLQLLLVERDGLNQLLSQQLQEAGAIQEVCGRW